MKDSFFVVRFDSLTSGFARYKSSCHKQGLFARFSKIFPGSCLVVKLRFEGVTDVPIGKLGLELL